MASTWLDEHLETFIRPNLGSVPNIDLENNWIKTFDKRTLIALNLIWHRTKVLAAGRTILLPGRDVYLFEVVARMLDDYPTICRPDISSCVAPYVAEDYSDTFVLDTGYKGSIPRSMNIQNWALVRYDYTSMDNKENRARRQVFPKTRSQTYLSLSGSLEGCPKYWTRGLMAAVSSKKGDKIVQHLDLFNMTPAAMLTIHVAKSVKLLKPMIERLAPQGRLF